MQAASVCVAEGIPFTFNMVITSRNRKELEQMVIFASSLGAAGVRFGHVMPSSETAEPYYDLSPEERNEAELEVWRMRDSFSIPIVMAPGYKTSHLFPCSPLRMKEFNIDCEGNVTICCHLSGHGDGAGSNDVVGNLSDMKLTEANRIMVEKTQEFRRDKIRQRAKGGLRRTDYFPCWYCSLYFRKVDWLKNVKGHPWSSLVRRP
jgi:MoaA/NifB/PqqE/SkfB family radical SAM enzyme